jgi:cell division septum initiation protein DivIVA
LSDIYHLIDRLERLLNESWRMPLSVYLVINEDDFLDVIDQMRTAIPREVKDGEKIQRERERIVAQAEEESERIVQMAKQEASGMVEEHELIQQAKQRADTILQRAKREAAVLKSEADEYATSVLLSLDDQLHSMEDQIASLQTIVRNGLETLTEGREAAAEEPD